MKLARIVFPEISNSIYIARSVPEAINLHISELNKLDSLLAQEYAIKFEEFNCKYISDRRYISYLRNNIFDSLYSEIDQTFPSLLFIIEGRRKSLIKFNKKLFYYTDNNRSVDLLRDQVAFRIIILGDSSTSNLSARCYDVMELCVRFCLLKHIFLCETDESNCMYAGDSGYQTFIKDYVAHPKSNGYQSLHAVFRQTEEPFFGRYFELQVRTMDMHIHSEIASSAASHERHNATRYGNQSDFFDPTKVKMDGFYYKNADSFFDYIGLLKSQQILSRAKSF